MIEVWEFRLHVVRPVIQQLGVWSMAAENLLLGTAVQESGLRHLRQLNEGPARGFYQIEPATHDDLWEIYIRFHNDWLAKMSAFLAPAPSQVDQLTTNLAYATAVARLLYWRHPEPLPSADDIEGLARYWKRYFHTHHGGGAEHRQKEIAQFVRNYKEQVK